MNKDQLRIYHTIINAINLKESGEQVNHVFIDAPGGTGKTFLLNAIIRKLQIDNIQYSASAHSGIAATLLTGGKTVHNTFKFPLDLQSDFKTGLTAANKYGRFIKACKVLIIDEASMLHRYQLEHIHIATNTLEDHHPTEQNLPAFANKFVVLAGDFPNPNHSYIET